MAIGWGGLWGPALGFWLLAPLLLDAQHLVPRSFSTWLVAEVYLLGFFAALGALLSIAATGVLVLWQIVRWRDFRDPAWAYGLAVPALLPLAYCGLSASLERWSFGAVVGLHQVRTLIVPALVAYGVFCLLAILGYGLVSHREPPPSRQLAFVAMAASLLGMASLPLRAPTWATAEHPPETLERRDGTPKPSLLFVGIDGGNWKVVEPLIARGALPTFARLAAEGMRGDVVAPWPPYHSAPAWSAIVTGYPRDETGVFEELAVDLPGLPPLQLSLVVDFRFDPIFFLEYGAGRAGLLPLAPPSRPVLERPPFWELLSRQGIETAVVRFFFTYPASGRADYVVSDRMGDYVYSGASPRETADQDLAVPASERSVLVGSFGGLKELPETLAELYPDGDAPGLDGAPPIPLEVLRIALAEDEGALTAAERLLAAHPDIPVLAVYLEGFDGICHGFWQYRFPGEFPDDPPPLAGSLGELVDRYVELLDRRIGRLLATYSVRPNVVIVADHGFEATRSSALWKGWHAPHGGLFLAAGPGVVHREQPVAVSYVDVAPTVFELLGFAPPPMAPGHSLLATR